MEKEKCDICHKQAVWFYGPGSEQYCNNHVPRGCSCNCDETGKELRDEKGRLFPCCEYIYFKEEGER